MNGSLKFQHSKTYNTIKTHVTYIHLKILILTLSSGVLFCINLKMNTIKTLIAIMFYDQNASILITGVK